MRRQAIPKHILEFPQLRMISQRRLRRFLEQSQAVEDLLEVYQALTSGRPKESLRAVIERLLDNYTDFRDDLTQDFIRGTPIESGPLACELHARRLQVRRLAG